MLMMAEKIIPFSLILIVNSLKCSIWLPSYFIWSPKHGENLLGCWNQQKLFFDHLESTPYNFTWRGIVLGPSSKNKSSSETGVLLCKMQHLVGCQSGILATPRKKAGLALPTLPHEIDKTRGAKLTADSIDGPFSLCQQIMHKRKKE